MVGGKRSAARWNWEMWSVFERDMCKLQVELLERNYGIARSSLTTLELIAHRNAELLGNAEAVAPSPLPDGDERRRIWSETARELRQILSLVGEAEYDQAAERLEAALNDVRIRTHEAIKAYNREQRKDPS